MISRIFMLSFVVLSTACSTSPTVNDGAQLSTAAEAVSSGVLASASTVEAASSKCDIKGNISRRGEKIFHLPSGQYWGRTRIDQSKGERLFCTPEEARAAGWRASKR